MPAPCPGCCGRGQAAGETMGEQNIEELTEEAVVANRQGIHARPAARLVEKALTFKSEVYISLNGRRINAKSIMGVLMLAAAQGSRLVVTCKGPDAREAMAAVCALIKSEFKEE